MDHERLEMCGLSRSQILELIGMSGVAVYANITADAAAVEPDDILQKLP
jgi:hypothetical protein